MGIVPVLVSAGQSIHIIEPSLKLSWYRRPSFSFFSSSSFTDAEMVLAILVVRLERSNPRGLAFMSLC